MCKHGEISFNEVSIVIPVKIVKLDNFVICEPHENSESRKASEPGDKSNISETTSSDIQILHEKVQSINLLCFVKVDIFEEKYR